jgi:hypothetical protein
MRQLLRSRVRSAALFVLSILAVDSGTLSRADVVTVSAQADIFGAGHPVVPSFPAGGGVLPPVVNFTPGANLVLTFASVTGNVSPDNGAENNGPDGGSGGTNINSSSGISGIVVDRIFPMVGVFLNNTEPANPAPPVLNFTGNTGFATLSPALQQVFYVGDGLTGTGTGNTQQFFIPAGATRLYLGFEDAQGFQGNPSFYGDNVGSFTATLSISNSVPEPSTLLTGGISASLFLAFSAYRRFRSASPTKVG